jgi:putative acetyltransferase
MREDPLLIDVRPEAPGDAGAVHRVHAAAFPTDEEARLVARLRAAGRVRVALVAEVGGAVVGHILFTPVTVEGDASATDGAGLAPVAVLPQFQRRGVGSQLVRDGLDACRRAGHSFAVVLGHSDYYPRFGFVRAAPLGLGNEYGAGDAFMAMELRPGGLPRKGGLVKYAPEFAGLGE